RSSSEFRTSGGTPTKAVEYDHADRRIARRVDDNADAPDSGHPSGAIAGTDLRGHAYLAQLPTRLTLKKPRACRARAPVVAPLLTKAQKCSVPSGTLSRHRNGLEILQAAY